MQRGVLFIDKCSRISGSTDRFEMEAESIRAVLSSIAVIQYKPLISMAPLAPYRCTYRIFFLVVLPTEAVLSGLVYAARARARVKRERSGSRKIVAGPAGIFTDHLADGIFGEGIPGIFDNRSPQTPAGE